MLYTIIAANISSQDDFDTLFNVIPNILYSFYT